MKITTALSALLLTACTLAPEYERPAFPASGVWPEGVSEASKQAAANIAWQDFFASPGVKSVIETALKNNRDLRVAALNVQAARALYRVQRASLLPSVDAEASGNKQKLPPAASTTGRESYTRQLKAQLSTSYELDLFGKLQSLDEAALETYFATQKARDEARISLIGEVANAYLQWLADRKLLAITEDTLKAQQATYDLTKRRADAAIANALEVAQAETALETAKSNLALYTRYVAQDRNALVLLMGVKDDAAALAQDETIDDVKLMETLPVGLPSQVLLLRPDVAEAEHTLKSYNANIGAARAAFFPDISLTATLGFASRGLSNLFSSTGNGAWSFAPQATLPLFDGGSNLANLEYSKLQKEQAVASYEQTIQAAFRDVADALAGRETLDTQYAAQKRLLQAAQHAYDLSGKRYKSGIDSYLTFLDAQRSLYSAQQSATQTQLLRMSNLVDLYKALGGGLAKPKAAPAPAAPAKTAPTKAAPPAQGKKAGIAK